MPHEGIRLLLTGGNMPLAPSSAVSNIPRTGNYPEELKAYLANCANMRSVLQDWQGSLKQELPFISAMTVICTQTPYRLLVFVIKMLLKRYLGVDKRFVDSFFNVLHTIKYSLDIGQGKEMMSSMSGTIAFLRIIISRQERENAVGLRVPSSALFTLRKDVCRILEGSLRQEDPDHWFDFSFVNRASLKLLAQTSDQPLSQTQKSYQDLMKILFFWTLLLFLETVGGVYLHSLSTEESHPSNPFIWISWASLLLARLYAPFAVNTEEGNSLTIVDFETVVPAWLRELEPQFDGENYLDYTLYADTTGAVPVITVVMTKPPRILLPIYDVLQSLLASNTAVTVGRHDNSARVLYLTPLHSPNVGEQPGGIRKKLAFLHNVAAYAEIEKQTAKLMQLQNIEYSESEEKFTVTMNIKDLSQKNAQVTLQALCEKVFPGAEVVLNEDFFQIKFEVSDATVLLDIAAFSQELKKICRPPKHKQPSQASVASAATNNQNVTQRATQIASTNSTATIFHALTLNDSLCRKISANEYVFLDVDHLQAAGKTKTEINAIITAFHQASHTDPAGTPRLVKSWHRTAPTGQENQFSLLFDKNQQAVSQSGRETVALSNGQTVNVYKLG